jgi:hypothetical protein
VRPHNIVGLGRHDGSTRPQPNRGREHFGFKDGISQPGIAGLTRSSRRGQDVIAAGEFMIGYADQDGNVSGQPVPVPQPGEPGYNPVAPPPLGQPLPDWAQNGSFLVFRRLRQNVQAFSDFIGQQAPQVGLDPDLFAAKLVGRWKSGAPLERTHDQAEGFDPTTADPSIADPSVLSDREINNFDYDPHDSDGHFMPRAAHIRKMNPRNEQRLGKDEATGTESCGAGSPTGQSSSLASRLTRARALCLTSRTVDCCSFATRVLLRGGSSSFKANGQTSRTSRSQATGVTQSLAKTLQSASSTCLRRTHTW